MNFYFNHHLPHLPGTTPLISLHLNLSDVPGTTPAAVGTVVVATTATAATATGEICPRIGAAQHAHGAVGRRLRITVVMDQSIVLLASAPRV